MITALLVSPIRDARVRNDLARKALALGVIQQILSQSVVPLVPNAAKLSFCLLCILSNIGTFPQRDLLTCATAQAAESLEERATMERNMVTVGPVPPPPLPQSGDERLATKSSTERDNGAQCHPSNEAVSNHPSCIWHSVSMSLAVPPPIMTPFRLSSPNDALHLSKFQVFLRLNIEAFAATLTDVAIRIRGRNKAIQVHQVGIRCRHCAHLATIRRVKAAVYFPSSTLGLYQAAQNMSTSHLQCGLCPQMPESIKTLSMPSTATQWSWPTTRHWDAPEWQFGIWTFRR
jgi:hypothetical protein